MKKHFFYSEKEMDEYARFAFVAGFALGIVAGFVLCLFCI